MTARDMVTLAVITFIFFFVLNSRRAFLNMCNSPEAFLSLRSHFISSHALLCVSHWILGIGDRHLSNFMINMETGGMIGIDFGHAFGSSTQVYPVKGMLTRLKQNAIEEAISDLHVIGLGEFIVWFRCMNLTVTAEVTGCMNVKHVRR